MADGSLSSPESPKPKEAPKKLAKKVGKKEVKGFYYHAAEYQRQRQAKEKNLVKKMFSSLVAPFTIHARALQLRRIAAQHGGNMKAWVIDNDFAQKALNNQLTEKDIKAFQAKTNVHNVFEKYQVSKADEAMAKSVLQEIFDKKGMLSQEDLARLQQESGMDTSDIAQLAQTAQENAGNGYMTAGEMKGKFADEAIYGGLNEEQVKLARQINRDAIFSTVFATGKYATLIALAASGPLGWGVGAGISGGLSAAMRVSSLNKEGGVYAMNKTKGIAQQQGEGWFHRLMGVDWDKDQKVIQVIRAAAVGAALGFLAKGAPQFLEHLQHGDIQNWIGGHVPHVGAVPVQTTEAVQNTLPVGNLHEHFQDATTNTNVHFLPDTTHHDWQQLHTFVQHDSQNNTFLELKYNGIDDGLAHNQHYIDVMLGGNQHVFIQNDAVLAINGDHAGDQIQLFHLVNGQVEKAGTISSYNLANELGLTQGKIENFATLTSAAHDHLWHGTQDASDLQFILQQRGLYNNGGNGEFLWGYRLGGGYFKDGQFYVGASNHYFSQGVLNNAFVPKEFPNLQVPGEAAEQFHSAIAHQPLGGLEGFDNLEDRGLEWLRENVFRDNIITALDNATDFGLYNMDNLALWMQGHIPAAVLERPWLLYPALSTPYLASGAVGYFYGKNRAQKAKGPLSTKTAGLIAEGALLAALPGAAVTAGLGFLVGKVTNRKGTKKEKPTKPTAPTESKPPTEPVPIPTPQPSPQPTPVPTPVPTPTPTPPAPPIGGGNPPIAPNPPPPTPTPEPLPVTTVLPATIPVISGVLESIQSTPVLGGIINFIQNGEVQLQNFVGSATQEQWVAFVNALYQPLAEKLGIKYNPNDVPELIQVIQKGNTIERLSFLVRLSNTLRDVYDKNPATATAIQDWIGKAKTILPQGTSGEAANEAVGQIAGAAEGVGPELEGFLGDVLAADAGGEAAAVLPELLLLL